jgi:hypothetical protein
MSADPRYPLGRFQAPETITPQHIASWIDEVAAAPAHLRQAVAGLTPGQLDTHYREAGWTVRQVTHHIPDSHMNAYVRFKMALTETDPPIRAYEEGEWAKLSDTAETPVETSVVLLEKLHERWVTLMRGFGDAEWKKCYVHPTMGPVPLERALGLYAWHGKHHVAHVTELRKRKGW